MKTDNTQSFVIKPEFILMGENFKKVETFETARADQFKARQSFYQNPVRSFGNEDLSIKIIIIISYIESTG